MQATPPLCTPSLPLPCDSIAREVFSYLREEKLAVDLTYVRKVVNGAWLQLDQSVQHCSSDTS
jgi:hypothetical protein